MVVWGFEAPGPNVCGAVSVGASCCGIDLTSAQTGLPVAGEARHMVPPRRGTAISLKYMGSTLGPRLRAWASATTSAAERNHMRRAATSRMRRQGRGKQLQFLRSGSLLVLLSAKGARYFCYTFRYFYHGMHDVFQLNLLVGSISLREMLMWPIKFEGKCV